jgi:glycosyltransferase involved in cell wall biosynthesis
VKVLMLGWELPPRISGGLGPACAGLARGLVDQGVEVVFVVPHLGGEERLEGARLVGADRVPLDPPAADAEPPPDGPGRAADAPRRPARARAVGGSDAEPPGWAADLPPEVRVLAVESALRPYLGEREYARLLERVQAPAPDGARASAPAGEGAAGAGSAAAATVEAPQQPGRDAPRSSCLSLQGGYGPDLFSEVARFARVAAALARRERFDLVHAHDWMTFPAGISAARAADRPLVAHVHASEFDRSGERADTRIRAIEAAGLAAARRVVCVSRYTAEVVGRRYGVPAERLRVVHNAVQPRQGLRETAPRRRHPLVLFLGRVTFQKGPEYFLEAAARVLAVAPDVRFVVSGSGDLLPRVVERAAELGIARRVSFTGFLERAAVERVLAMADVYVMPSVSEPFGIAPLEAMAQDVPVIVSRQSGVAEVLKSALKVDYWDVEEMANKILALLRYPALRSTLAGEGRSELEGMSWTERGRRLREVYEEVVA